MGTHIAAMLILPGCVVSQPAYKVPEKNCIDENGLCKKFDGVPYVLPRTTLKVTIPVISTNETEGSFVSELRKKKASASPFANNKCIKHVYDLGDKIGVEIFELEKPKISYELSDVSVGTGAEPDPNQLYYLQVKGKLFEKRSLDITYADSGILNTLTSSSEDKTAEFAAKTLGSILGAAAKFGTFQVLDDRGEQDQLDVDCAGSPYKNIVYRAMGTLKFIETFPSIRNKELTGVSNNAAPGKDNLELRLKELDASYSAALAVFKGSKKKVPKTYEVTLLPELDDRLPITLAQFSTSCGLSQAKVTVPSQIVQSNIPKSCSTDSNTSNITAILTSPPNKGGTSLPTRISDSLDSGTNERGIYYRVPKTSRISIQEKNLSKTNESEVVDLLVQDVAIAQFGKTASLPASTGSSNVRYQVTLDPVTGMLLKVKIDSETANTSIAQDIATPAGDYLKARKESHDELEQLKREDDILKTKLSIIKNKVELAK